MRMLAILLAAATVGSSKASLPSQMHDGGQIKAVLIAGSMGYDNYRHQADICHAYQLLHRNGIPDENIIVMMYDDIANNTDNPKPGVIINRPGGPNMYEGVPKDYTGEEVTKMNLFNVLNGNKSALKGVGTGRVLESGPNDHVFINFVDHGGTGILCLPNEDIKASEVIEVLKNMSSNNRFQKMFLYVEACESGSIFDDLLPDDLNIFVMTAADPRESSYACFYDEELQTYLGDVFSVKWMHNSEMNDLRKESVNRQFEDVRHETNTSHVEEYGDIDIGSTKMSEVIGFSENPELYSLQINDAVPSYHVPVAIIAQRLKRAKTSQERNVLRDKLHSTMEDRKKMNDFFINILAHFYDPTTSQFTQALLNRTNLTYKNVHCYEKVVSQIIKDCFSIYENPYAASHLYKILNLCNQQPEDTIIKKISSLCNGKARLKGVV